MCDWLIDWLTDWLIINDLILKVREFLDSEVYPVLAKYPGQLEGSVSLAV